MVWIDHKYIDINLQQEPGESSKKVPGVNDFGSSQVE